MPTSGATVCSLCCAAFVLTIIIILSNSFESLDQLSLGLNYNSITLQLEDEVYTKAGMYFLGVGHYFIKYPRTVQTIEFVAEENDRLQTRTSDGLPVSLSVSFQYRYDAQRLRENYLQFKGEELEVYENTAKAVIANVATGFSAFHFFNDKQGIAADMQVEVTRVFSEQLYADLDAFQITRVELPPEFQNAILESIQAKQNITSAERYLDNMMVTFSTQILISNQTRQQTIALARGTANQRTLQAEANARVTQQTVSAEMYAYGNFSASVDLNTTEGLSYMWWSDQRYRLGKNFLVGINPDSMITTKPTSS